MYLVNELIEKNVIHRPEKTGGKKHIKIGGIFLINKSILIKEWSNVR